MKTAIVYISKHGTTEKIAKEISIQMPKNEVHLFNLKVTQNIPIDDFDIIIIGASIHMGLVHKHTSNFCKNNLQTLLNKRVGIYVCSMEEGDKAQEQITNSFPPELLKHAEKCCLAGHEFIMAQMNFFEKILCKKIVGTTSDVSQLNTKNVKQLVEHFRQ